MSVLSPFRLAPNPITLARAVRLAGGQLVRGEASQKIIAAVSPMGVGGAGGRICFVADGKLAGAVPNDASLVCVTTPEFVRHLPDKPGVIACAKSNKDSGGKGTGSGDVGAGEVSYIKDCFVKIMRVMYPAPVAHPRIHRSAVVADNAKIGKGVEINAFVSIGAKAVIGDGCIIHAGAVIDDGVVLGEGCIIEARATISHSVIGNHAYISQGASIGHCGFGLDGGGRLVPHIGRVVIGDYAYIGASTNIDRGMLDDTIIGDYVMVDSLCHIAHNVVIGTGSVICAQSAFGGSARLGRRNTLGPRVGVVSHALVGDNNLFVAQCGVTKDIGDNTVMGGFPAVPIGEYRRQVAAIRQLTRTGKSKAQKGD